MCSDSQAELKFIASLGISNWLYPTLEFDFAYCERDKLGAWNKRWNVLNKELEKPDFDEMLGALTGGLYLHHLIQLILEYPERCRQARNSWMLLDTLQKIVTGESEKVVLKTFFPSKLYVGLVKLLNEDSFRKRSCLKQKIVTNCYSFIKVGPLELFEAAEIVLSVFSQNNIPALLTGGLALFIQCPFRLSPDIDITVARNMSESEVDVVVTQLEDMGIIFTQKFTNYLGGIINVSIPYSVDIEIGYAYHGIEKINEDFISRADITCGGCAVMAVKDIISLKKKSGRLKDLMDIAFLESIL
jgi:hypothetical protein